MTIYGDKEQILAEEEATDETVIVYTVPTGYKLYLCHAILETDAGATGIGRLKVRDENDVEKYTLGWMDVRENNKGVIPGRHFCPCWPVTMTAGQNIAVTSDAASLAAQNDIFGFEVNA